MTPHPHLEAIDPPRKHPARRWRCQACKQTGLFDDLRQRPCTAPPKEPCQWCGGTPTCQPDCVGVSLALSGENVKVIDPRQGT